MIKLGLLTKNKPPIYFDLENTVMRFKNKKDFFGSKVYVFGKPGIFWSLKAQGIRETEGEVLPIAYYYFWESILEGYDSLNLFTPKELRWSSFWCQWRNISKNWKLRKYSSLFQTLIVQPRDHRIHNMFQELFSFRQQTG